ncbi:DUF4424 family protein [uncultured Rhodoblastus sp.]|uniref:DUF4424 family protein n=1 Tax=uncultured Rhodoblastus sp. TaxID=543037 RepID=UPI0025EFF49A|nr:DUF4424 family protein [uncultured Rhodoblastus sp.]
MPKAIALGVAFLIGGAALAAESLTELATGGIEFLKVSDNAALVLDSEEVRLTPTRSTFSYIVSNKGAIPLELVLGFRFPELDFSDPDAQYAIPGSDPVNFLNATVRIDGAAAPFAITQRALLDGKDVTDLLRQTKVALVPVGQFQNQLADTAPELRDKLVGQGLIVESGTSIDGKPLFFPSWTVKTSSTRRVVVPPAGSIRIELQYRPSVGVGPDTVLRKPLRDQKGLEADVRGKRATFCVDEAFLNGLDKLAGVEEANVNGVKELRLHLKTKMYSASSIPATHYKLVVDKESTQRILSFCAGELKKISETSFEMRADNYVPSAEINILMIDRKGLRPVNLR